MAGRTDKKLSSILPRFSESWGIINKAVVGGLKMSYILSVIICMMDRVTDRWTEGQVKNIIPLQLVAWGIIKSYTYHQNGRSGW